MPDPMVQQVSWYRLFTCYFNQFSPPYFYSNYHGTIGPQYTIPSWCFGRCRFLNMYIRFTSSSCVFSWYTYLWWCSRRLWSSSYWWTSNWLILWSWCALFRLGLRTSKIWSSLGKEDKAKIKANVELDV
jgi:hypothetical protein